MAIIPVKQTTRVEKTVPNVTPNHLVFTKSEDRIIITLDANLCKEFEDREAFLEKLYNELNSTSNRSAYVSVMNG